MFHRKTDFLLSNTNGLLVFKFGNYLNIHITLYTYKYYSKYSQFSSKEAML